MFGQMIFDEYNRPVDRTYITDDVRREINGDQNGKCGICGDSIIDEIDHKLPRGGQCHGSDHLQNYQGLCSFCHKLKTQDDHTRMNIEDHNFWISRFNEETYRDFVQSRRPTQVVCNLHDPDPNLSCLEIDVNSCRLNGILEANQEDVPIYSPLDEFTHAQEGVLYDYMWVEIGKVRSPLLKYIYDGPRWFSKATVKFMLETQVCQWKNIKLGFNATSRRTAADFAHCLKRINKIWLDVGVSDQAKKWAELAKNKTDIPTCSPKPLRPSSLPNPHPTPSQTASPPCVIQRDSFLALFRDPPYPLPPA